MINNHYSITFLYYCWTIAKARAQANPSVLFGMEEKSDKLIIKNQIAYHFKKVIREVKEELFVSRRIDVSLLYAGLSILQETENKVRDLCKSLPPTGKVLTIVNHPIPTVASAPEVITKVVYLDQQGRSLNREPFTLVEVPHYASFKEAKARCIALGKQLPEIYTEEKKTQLLDFLKAKNIAQCFAGIEPDLSDAIPRHISTQYPIWKSAYRKAHECAGGQPELDLKWSVDDGHAKFLYQSDGRLCISRDYEGNPINHGKYADHKFREHNQVLSQIVTRIVCSPRWDGNTDIDISADNMDRGGITVKTRFQRSLRAKRLRRSNDRPAIANMQNVQTLCLGVADHAKESYTEIQSKMVELLALVDITVHEKLLSEHRQKRDRPKRVVQLFAMKFIFVTGVKLLWQLFGFVQKVKMNNRLKNIESMLEANSDRSSQNSKSIAKMTKLIEGNSVAVKELSVQVDGLEHRLSSVETQLGTLREGVKGLAYKFEIVTALVTIDNLVIRTRRSMDTGYDILKDIIHSSVLKQTSPLVLPLDQMELVQTEIAKSTTALLDPDFAKMQSIVVSDPSDPTKLLVVVNLAALDRRDLELVQMIPVPYFEGKDTFEILLDYQYIVLDQSAHTFSILSEQEENDCLYNRCYISSAEQSLLEKSCGIPQFYDQHKKVCVARNIDSLGVFLKPMLPDGVIFALRNEVRSEVFCLGKPIGNSKPLKGTGILQLPNGCVLQIIDNEGKVFKVKGLPQHTVMNAGDFNLMQGGPLSALHAEVNTSNTRKVSTINSFVEDRVSSVIKQVEQVDNRMFEQHRHVWILTGTISLTLLIIVLAILLLYRFSKRARRKIRDIRGNFSELSRKVINFELDNPANVNFETVESGPTAPPIQRKRDVWTRRHREQREKDRILRETQNRMETDLPINDKEGSYMNMSELGKDENEARYVSRPLSRSNEFSPLRGTTNYPSNPREYPRIPPSLIEEAEDYELERLREETELSVKLSRSLDPKNFLGEK